LGYAGSVVDITERKHAEEQLRALSARLIGAQEDERKRLARELHDDLNQQIAALSIAMGNLKRHIPEEQAETRAQSDRIYHKLVQLSESVRRLSHDLHPAILQYAGLVPALRSYCDTFTKLTRIEVAFQTDGSVNGVAPASALCLYRITQEALQNVSKHAKVNAAQVKVVRSNGQLRLTVSDAGVGMAESKRAPSAGLGLISIKERTRLVRGRMEIVSAPNEGTTIRVSIPE
jgi:signal transduction histidine kinase